MLPEDTAHFASGLAVYLDAEIIALRDKGVAVQLLVLLDRCLCLLDLLLEVNNDKALYLIEQSLLDLWVNLEEELHQLEDAVLDLPEEGNDDEAREKDEDAH